MLFLCRKAEGTLLRVTKEYNRFQRQGVSLHYTDSATRRIFNKSPENS